MGDLEVVKKAVGTKTTFCGDFDSGISSGGSGGGGSGSGSEGGSLGDSPCMGAPIDAGVLGGESAAALMSSGELIECEFEFSSQGNASKIVKRLPLAKDAQGNHRCVIDDSMTVYEVVDDDGNIPQGDVALVSSGVVLKRMALEPYAVRRQIACADFKFVAAPRCVENPENPKTSVSVLGKSIEYANAMSITCVFADELNNEIAQSPYTRGECSTSADISGAKQLKLVVSSNAREYQSLSKLLDDISCPNESSSAGAIIGAIAGVGIIGAALFLAYKKRQRDKGVELKDKEEAIVSYVGDLTDQFPHRSQEMPKWNPSAPQKHKRVDSDFARGVDAAMYGNAGNRPELSGMNPSASRRADDVRSGKGARASAVDRAMYQGAVGGESTFGNPLRQKRKAMLEKGQMSKRMGDVLFSQGDDDGAFKNPMSRSKEGAAAEARGNVIRGI